MSLTTDPNDPALKKIEPGGQQQAYLVLSEEERAKGFVRPVCCSYVHLKCGVKTTMGRALAETYARDPKFYGGTFCCGCGQHFRLREFNSATEKWEPAFLWTSDGTPVGSTAEEAEQYLAEKSARDAELRAAAERLSAAGREIDASKDALFNLLRVEPVDGQAFADAQARCRKAIVEHTAAQEAADRLRGRK